MQHRVSLVVMLVLSFCMHQGEIFIAVCIWESIDLFAINRTRYSSKPHPGNTHVFPIGEGLLVTVVFASLAQAQSSLAWSTLLSLVPFTAKPSPNATLTSFMSSRESFQQQRKSFSLSASRASCKQWTYMLVFGHNRCWLKWKRKPSSC